MSVRKVGIKAIGLELEDKKNRKELAPIAIGKTIKKLYSDT